MADKLGLVLSGGGAKGAYEIGVYKALEILGADKFIGAIAGTSVGALNAVLLEDRGIGAAIQLWSELKFSDLMHIDKSALSKFQKIGDIFDFTGSSESFIDKSLFTDMLKNGLPVSQKKIEELIDENISFKNLKRNIYVICSQIGKKPVCFELNNYDSETQKQIILASSALPGIYRGVEGVKVGDEYYYDGGITHEGNTPIMYMYEKGYRNMIAVHLKSNAYTADQCQFYDAKIVNIIPSKNLGNFITGTLNLNQTKVLYDMELGYYDAINKSQEIIELINSLI